MTKKTEQLDEFKASFGVNAEVPEPVEAGSTTRPADKTGGDPKPAGPSKAEMISDIVKKAYGLSNAELTKVHADVANAKTLAPGSKHSDPMPKLSMKEDLEAIFGGESLDEEFIAKAETLFEAAVTARFIEYKAQLDEKYDVAVEEGIGAGLELVNENLSNYLDYVVEEWMAENKLAVDSGLRGEMMESFLGGLRTLFVEHYIEIPEDKVDVVEQLTDKVAALEEKLNEATNKNLELATSLEAAEIEKAFSEATEGLTDTQVEKLRSLSESVEYSDVTDFSKKVSQIKESLIVQKKDSTAASQTLTEAVELDEEVKPAGKALASDPGVARVVAALSSKKR